MTPNERIASVGAKDQVCRKFAQRRHDQSLGGVHTCDRGLGKEFRSGSLGLAAEPIVAGRKVVPR
jgi:hypothetical protein